MRAKTRRILNIRRRLWRGEDIVLAALPLDRYGLPQLAMRIIRFKRRHTAGGREYAVTTIEALRRLHK